ncbi:C40 family peptidase [Pseudonocardia sp. K10HN5]|uniref:C40 family peptidase n=2 Tax=Pseudonocardia acidicola TaxID=2724939 RepID=A0ABX1SIG0_9PSEU|nr:NlpC/P60 family protein [Pseudonocardia acidicola]NMI00623.1 C40 family peptidase [Pseudonocardia acidicola]
MTTLGIAVLAAFGGALPGGGCGGDGGTGGGSQQIGPRAWSAEQTANAQTITQIAVQRGLPRRAAVIAVATAIVESALTNVHYGDRDSLGLFQQRPSQGWGGAQQVINPAYAANTFYDRLLAVPGWATLPPGQAAQAVQRSAFPGRYGPQEAAAAALVARFWAGPDNPAPPLPGAAGRDTAQLASLSTLACPDQGGSNLPLTGGTVDPRQLPPGFGLPTDPRQRAAVAYALAQVGKPYVWGAKGPGAFDCSGLMQAAWAAAGVPISAGTVTQKTDGTPVPGLAQVAPGDLLFIPGSLGTPANPRHVGMYAGGGIVVNAYDSSTGVILEPLDRWADKIVAIRHIAGPSGAPPSTSVLAEGAAA